MPDETESETTELLDALAEKANDPASASADGQSVTAHSLRDQIELLKLRAAAKRKGSGMKLIRIIPPGAV